MMQIAIIPCLRYFFCIFKALCTDISCSNTSNSSCCSHIFHSQKCKSSLCCRRRRQASWCEIMKLSNCCGKCQKPSRRSSKKSCFAWSRAVHNHIYSELNLDVSIDAVLFSISFKKELLLLFKKFTLLLSAKNVQRSTIAFIKKHLHLAFERPIVFWSDFFSYLF